MKVILITGINRGLGEAFFYHFLDKKDYLIVGISRQINQAQLSLLNEEKFVFIQADLQKIKSLENLNILRYFEKAEEVIYINNAATINPINKVGGFETKEIQDIIQLNTIAPIFISNYLFKEISEKKITILNISSGASTSAIVGWSLYCATKAANEMFFNVLKAQEKDNSNVKVFNINPGVMNSGMQESIRNIDESVFPRVKEFIRLKEENKLLDPLEVVKRVLLETNSKL
ncbi:MAG: SDR family NAD(P)-dependent oxidoreductase [Flavobacteriaceae bacterium]